MTSGRDRGPRDTAAGRALRGKRLVDLQPDGTRVVATRFDGLRFRIVVLDPADGRLLSTLATGDDLVTDASWVDDRRVIGLERDLQYSRWSLNHPFVDPIEIVRADEVVV